MDTQHRKILGTGAVILAVGLAAFPPVTKAQIDLSGQMAVYVYKSAHSQGPREINHGRPSFGWQTDLFMDSYLTDHVAAQSTVRITDDQVINFDYVAITLADVTPLDLNIRAGKFDLPFGNLGDRRFPRRNPLFGLPLIYEYRTALPEYVTTSTELLTSRGRGYGMRLLDLGMYDLGAMVYGSTGVIDYAFAVANGTVSTSSYGIENSNGDFDKILRLAVTPLVGLTFGGAYAQGAYLEQSVQATQRSLSVDAYQQRAAEADLAFSRGHAVFYAQGVYAAWQVPLENGEETLSASGYYVEGKYTLMPRLYVAVRLNGLFFNDVPLGQTVSPWDYNVSEVEGGVGYFLDRDVLLKLVRRETRTHGGSMPNDNLTVLQLTVAY